MKRVLLDGGMGQELLKRWGKEPHPLWSAQVMLENPEIVQSVHEDYIRAGARVITLNSYTATPERLSREGVADQFKPLQQRAVDLARAARDAAGDCDIAGSLPPLHGSFIPDMTRSDDMLFNAYTEIVAVQAGKVDFIICETMASIAEARAATRAAQSMGVAVWCGFTLDDDNLGTLRSGEQIADAIAEITKLNPDAIVYNCSRPETISHSLDFIVGDRPFGAYANGFTHIGGLEIGGTVKTLTARTDLDPETLADHVDEWMVKGAHIVGGCCETGPTHIAALAARIAKNGDTAVKWSEL